jgi:hypothetical protein
MSRGRNATLQAGDDRESRVRRNATPRTSPCICLAQYGRNVRIEKVQDRSLERRRLPPAPCPARSHRNHNGEYDTGFHSSRYRAVDHGRLNVGGAKALPGQPLNRSPQKSKALTTEAQRAQRKQLCVLGASVVEGSWNANQNSSSSGLGRVPSENGGAYSKPRLRGSSWRTVV